MFMAMKAMDKEEYARRPGARVLFGGRTLLMLLLWHQANFLMLDEPWVDALLKSEQDVRGGFGRNCLILLCCLGRLDCVDFSCSRFCASQLRF